MEFLDQVSCYQLLRKDPVSWRLVQSVWTIQTLEDGCSWHTVGISLSSVECTENWVECGDKFLLSNHLLQYVAHRNLVCAADILIN